MHRLACCGRFKGVVMSVIVAIFKVFICAISMLIALGAASVENIWLLVSMGILIGLIVPSANHRVMLRFFVILTIVLIWRIFYVWHCRGCDYVSYGIIYILTISIVLLSLVYVRWRQFRYVLWSIVAVFVLESAFYSRNCSFINSEGVAYLERGRWGISHSESKELEIKSQYSYNVVKRCLSASSISSIDSLEKYS